MSKIEKREVQQVIDDLKKEVGDDFAVMRATPLNGISKDELVGNLRAVVLELWREAGFNQVLKAVPRVKFEYDNDLVRAIPENESARRVMQLLNIQKATHRIKPKESEYGTSSPAVSKGAKLRNRT